MNFYTILEVIAFAFYSFIPVWAGGQAMNCYERGHPLRSAAAVIIATALNATAILVAMAWARNNWGFVTFLSNLMP